MAIGPHSRPGILAIVDGRRAEAQLMKRVRDDLSKHCGGHPSATQRLLINQAAMLALRLHLMDREALQDDGGLSDRNARQYLAWANSLSRLLRQLGLRSVEQRPPDLRQHLAARAAAKPGL